MNRNLSRRAFLAASAAAGLSSATWTFGQDTRPVSPNSKLNVACIGVGGIGWTDLHNIAGNPRVNLVAICDIEDQRLDAAAKDFPNARRYSDWRELLDREDKNIDAVSVSTPDHMHAPIGVSAMLRGKHLYGQKPLAHDLHEARVMTETARRRKVVTQMGIQNKSGVALRLAVQLIQAGAIGKVKEVHLWTPFLKWFFENWGRIPPENDDPLTPSLHWDLWLGVAPERPFHNRRYHPGRWRNYPDFGTGALGDMGCHMLDPIVTALELGAPLAVTNENPGLDGERYPTGAKVRYEFAGTARTAGKTIDVTWYDGSRAAEPQVPLEPGQERPIHGTLIVGENGSMLLPMGAGPQLLPAGQFRDYPRPRLEPVDHYGQWVNACLGEGATCANFDYAGPLAETVLLGVLAYRFPQQRLQWDPKALKITNVAEANRFLRREYRKGWEIEGLS